MRVGMLDHHKPARPKQPRSQREHRRHQAQPVRPGKYRLTGIVPDLRINRRSRRHVGRIRDDDCCAANGAGQHGIVEKSKITNITSHNGNPPVRR